MRWLMVQFLIAIGSAVAIVIRVTQGAIEDWFWILVGSAILAISIVMARISAGIRGNAVALRKAGQIIGDVDLPDVSNRWKSATHYMTILVGLLGAALLLNGAQGLLSALGAQ